MKNLLQFQSATDSHRWLAVADEIRIGRCFIKNLQLGLLRRSSSTEANTEAIKALASAI
jgi:hypothetical protein